LTIVLLLVVGGLLAGVGVLAGRLRIRQAELDDARREVAAVRADAEGERAQADESRARLTHALDAIPQAVLIADADGRVVARNRAADSFAEARHGDALVEAAIDELLADALAGHEGVRPVELFGPPRRALVVAASPLPDGALVVVDDISDRRRLDATRRDFVANISHELKTPVAAMGLLAETLLSEDDPKVSARLAERIVDEAFRLDRTIEDLLVLSRIEGEEATAHEPVAAALLLVDAAERIRPAAEQAGIDVVVDPVDPALVVRGDRRQLVSALANLLDNAVKYSDDGAEVHVRAVAVASSVALEVEDHGIGIPKADLERIFERFYRVDHARSRATGGTGLGLAIVRHVATNHGGEVRVESRLGEGSTFTLVVPAADTVAPPAAPSRPSTVDPPVGTAVDRAVDQPADRAVDRAVDPAVDRAERGHRPVGAP
jgi:two-component system sensor histidine kinase SenX3